MYKLLNVKNNNNLKIDGIKGINTVLKIIE